MEGKKLMVEGSGKDQNGGKDRPKYVPPSIVSYSSEELIEQLGPALSCSPTPCPPSN